MAAVDQQEPLTPRESLALIERTLAHARHELGFSQWTIYVTWGLVWLVVFGVSQLAESGPAAPLAGLAGSGAGLVRAVALGVGIVATGVLVARQSRGVDGASARVGARIALAWVTALVAAGFASALLSLDGYQSGALFVLVVALLYAGAGAVLLDDVQLALGVWFLVVTVAGLAAGPDWFNLILALLGGGGFLVGGAVARRRADACEDDG